MSPSSLLGLGVGWVLPCGFSWVEAESREGLGWCFVGAQQVGHQAEQPPFDAFVPEGLELLGVVVQVEEHGGRVLVASTLALMAGGLALDVASGRHLQQRDDFRLLGEKSNLVLLFLLWK